MRPLYVSFATPAYAAHAAGLVETLDAFGLEHRVVALPSEGSWVANCNAKSQFVLSMMMLHPDRPIVWLDADARVRQYPALFDDLDCDIACHFRHGVELMSGTLYLGPTPNALRLCEAWVRRCEERPDQWDQISLADVIGDVPGLRVTRLPAGYTRVFDDPKMGKAVIEHLQGSRQLAKAL